MKIQVQEKATSTSAPQFDLTVGDAVEDEEEFFPHGTETTLVTKCNEAGAEVSHELSAPTGEDDDLVLDAHLLCTPRDVTDVGQQIQGVHV